MAFSHTHPTNPMYQGMKEDSLLHDLNSQGPTTHVPNHGLDVAPITLVA